MSPIPRARNPGGFRPTSSGSITTTTMPMTGDDSEEFNAGGGIQFGEVVGLVGGWEDKIRSATAWAVVNTTRPTSGVPMEDDEMMGSDEQEGRSDENGDVNE